MVPNESHFPRRRRDARFYWLSPKREARLKTSLTRFYAQRLQRKCYLVSFVSLVSLTTLLALTGAFLCSLTVFTLAFLLGAGAASVLLAAGAGLDAGFAANAGIADAAIIAAIISDENFDMAKLLVSNLYFRSPYCLKRYVSYNFMLTL